MIIRGGRTAEEARQIAEPAIEALDLALIEVHFVRENNRQYLRYIIDKRGGVGIDDCVAVSQAVDPLLDASFSWTKPYHLEVQSAGLERPLRTAADFERHAGAEVELRFYRARDGQRRMTAELVSGDDEQLTVRLDDGETLSLPRAEIAHIVRTLQFN